MYSMRMIDGPHSPTPGFLVWRLSIAWRTAVDRAVAPYDLTHASYSVLASLYGMTHEGRQPNQRQLADQTGLEVVYISKLVRALEHKDLLIRRQDPADSRAVTLSLSEEGETIAVQAINTVRALMETLTAPLGGTASARTRRFMEDLRTLLDR